MDKSFELFETVVPAAAGITAEHPLAPVLVGRENVIELTQKSHDAVLRPRDCGGLPHSLRAALACRIATHNEEAVLADHFQGLIGGAGPESESDSAYRIADLAFDGGDDKRLKAVIRYTDLVAVNPKDASARDIESLKSNGITDDDIVRLSELIALRMARPIAVFSSKGTTSSR